MTKSKLTLSVHELQVQDCWKDIVRIPRDYRVDVNAKRIRRAKICKVTVNEKSKLLAVRGCPEKDARILVDSPTRHDLEIDVGNSYEVELRPVWWYGYWKWAWNAADPAYRVPAQISLISLVLGVIGLFLGLWPIISPHLFGHSAHPGP
jgi:hypothetical protein